MDGDDIRWVSETQLYTRAYDKYLALKNAVVYDPQVEIEELKKKLAASESSKAKDISKLENAAKKASAPAVKEETKPLEA